VYISEKGENQTRRCAEPAQMTAKRKVDWEGKKYITPPIIFGTTAAQG
jgi:hypothetical protein